LLVEDMLGAAQRRIDQTVHLFSPAIDRVARARLTCCLTC
jgi:hypothetical protein